jgi:TP901-1 family phage major tail protein
MAAQKGSEFLLKIGDGAGPEVFTAIGGFRSNSFKINNETVDITNKDSAGVRTLMAGGGITSFSASGSGVFMDDTAFATAEAAARGNTQDNWQIIVPDYGTYTGAFNLTGLEYAGEHNGEATYTINLESAGTISFAAI